MSPSIRLAPQAKIYHEIVYKSLPKTSKISLSALDRVRFVGGVILNGCGFNFFRARFARAIIHLGPPPFRMSVSAPDNTHSCHHAIMLIVMLSIWCTYRLLIMLIKRKI